MKKLRGVFYLILSLPKIIKSISEIISATRAARRAAEQDKIQEDLWRKVNKGD